MNKVFSPIVLIISSVLLLVSCTNSNDQSFPQVASPPPFDYVDGQELRGNMHQLAFALLRLDSDLSRADENNPVDQQDIVQTLQRIKEIGDGIQSEDLRERHPYLVSGMYRFMNDVDQALFQASLRSPRYYMAGRISGSCVNCHRAND
ncbi:hypothetical protein [Pseudemcibacter aquimaris]|uniref:hypothetical protein n=1 Tax=Pseudemcibacter aquimaris TaxID=2857064 RepID=UPI0020123565|nr:hypothetical protein [Pseudemcibacter aquimaris]MCC3860504.1 hypothetical protein [Pseudemcibacter aquimaris]WDU59329.1 hypothetical protein KW060_03505 [Pseudemcibacter aquimaris]